MLDAAGGKNNQPNNKTKSIKKKSKWKINNHNNNV